jgi:hypothetical protein
MAPLPAKFGAKDRRTRRGHKGASTHGERGLRTEEGRSRSKGRRVAHTTGGDPARISASIGVALGPGSGAADLLRMPTWRSRCQLIPAPFDGEAQLPPFDRSFFILSLLIWRCPHHR